jgi:hypothetical protein
MLAAEGMHASTNYIPLLLSNGLSEVSNQPSTLIESHTAITPNTSLPSLKPNLAADSSLFTINTKTLPYELFAHARGLFMPY